jgi:phosphatidylserine/phosphatidylglycerophosphate/cardiolipin synthase-like enzyme
VASGAAVAVCFAPEEDCAAFAVRAIDNAESEILVSAYGLTTGSGIVEALARAEGRGVDVRLIADKTRLAVGQRHRASWPRLTFRSG